jgi:hypothetical protein
MRRLPSTVTSLDGTSRVSPPCDTCSLIRLHSTKTSLDGTFRRSPTWKRCSLRRHHSIKISALGGVNYLSRMLRLKLIECLIKAAVLFKTIPSGPFCYSCAQGTYLGSHIVLFHGPRLLRVNYGPNIRNQTTRNACTFLTLFDCRIVYVFTLFHDRKSCCAW